MSENTKIEWADHTFNPWVGCTKMSPACDHCYAERWAKRSGMVQWGGERKRTSAANWDTPLKWNAQAEREGRRFKVFCSSLADVFDNQVDLQWRIDLFELIAKTPNLDWLLLTKRIGNAPAMLNEVIGELSHGINTWDKMPWPGVWIGATICNQPEYDRDIGKLLRTPAARHFLSVEPMLSAIDMRMGGASVPAFSAHRPLNQLDWMICGGESGPGARPMHPEWAASLRNQCEAAGVPFMFKQWGEWSPCREVQTLEGPGGSVMSGLWLKLDGTTHTPLDSAPWDASDAAMRRVGKSAAGRVLDGRIHNDFPEPR